MRDEIKVAAGKLFSQYSIRSITMDEISAAMGISKKTLYVFFNDKNELVEQVYLAALRRAEKQCITTSGTSADAIQEAIQYWNILKPVLQPLTDKVVHDLQKFHQEVFEKYEQFRMVFLCRLIQKNIERGKREGYYRADVEAGIIARHEVSTMIAKHNPFVSDNQRWSLTEIDEQLILRYLKGIASETGFKLIEQYRSSFSKTAFSR